MSNRYLGTAGLVGFCVWFFLGPVLGKPLPSTEDVGFFSTMAQVIPALAIVLVLDGQLSAEGSSGVGVMFILAGAEAGCILAMASQEWRTVPDNSRFVVAAGLAAVAEFVVLALRRGQKKDSDPSLTPAASLPPAPTAAKPTPKHQGLLLLVALGFLLGRVFADGGGRGADRR